MLSYVYRVDFLQGEEWKAHRKRFNSGFAPQHLVTLLPQILQKTSIFTAKLDKIAASGEVVEMDPICTNLTFDIIGALIMNLDFGAQGDDSLCHPVVKDFRDLVETFTDTGRIWLWLNVPVRIRRVICSRRSDSSIKAAILQKFDEIKQTQHASKKKDRSVLALALQDTETLTPAVLQNIADQVKTFLFAGHDTTSIALQRLFYALSTHPKALAAIRAEHDSIFGDEDPHAVFLARPDETLHALTYTSACIKEALRLWPPAASARIAPPGSNFYVKLDDGRDVCLDGLVMYINHYIIQRDPKVYGETADDFVPERWLDDKIPPGAWRPFERGPRGCIGQELANLEARVILACVMRRYDFTKVGAGAILRDEKGMPVMDEGKERYKVVSELFNVSFVLLLGLAIADDLKTMQVTSKPFDKMRMTVQLRKG